MIKRLATCPTCGGSCEFTYVGSQHWPADVAKRLNLPMVMHLWTCAACETTVTDHDLRPYRQASKRATQVNDLPILVNWE
jgi:hypothetical protein